MTGWRNAQKGWHWSWCQRALLWDMSTGYRCQPLVRELPHSQSCNHYKTCYNNKNSKPEFLKEAALLRVRVQLSITSLAISWYWFFCEPDNPFPEIAARMTWFRFSTIVLIFDNIRDLQRDLFCYFYSYYIDADKVNCLPFFAKNGWAKRKARSEASRPNISYFSYFTRSFASWIPNLPKRYKNWITWNLTS